jgi:hypothetical protein
MMSVAAYVTEGPGGDLWCTDLGNKASRGSIGRVTTRGRATNFTRSAHVQA